jgi:hypothetical protein
MLSAVHAEEMIFDVAGWKVYCVDARNIGGIVYAKNAWLALPTTEGPVVTLTF